MSNSRPLVLLVVLALFSAPSIARADAAAQTYLYVGEPDPNGADQAFLALARRHGATAARESPGHLEGESPSARLSEAIAAYDALRFSDAIAALDSIDREVTVSGGGRLTQGELIDLHAYRAAARMALGEESSAWDDLVALAVLAPLRPLDPAHFSPRLIDAARRAAKTVTVSGTLVLSARPPDALLIVDGQLVGRGRVGVSRPVGRHLVRAERSGFLPSGQAIDLPSAGVEATLTLTPAPVPTAAQLAAWGAVAGARHVVAAFVTGSDEGASLALDLVDVAARRVVARAQVKDDEHLTTAEIAAAIDSLWSNLIVPSANAPAREAAAARSRRWYRSPLLWSVAGGLAAAALGIGLGVGLSGPGPGASTHVELGPAR